MSELENEVEKAVRIANNLSDSVESAEKFNDQFNQNMGKTINILRGQVSELSRIIKEIQQRLK